MGKVILYIHGKGGSYKEAQQYRKNCEGYEIVGVDYELDFPWIVGKKLQAEYDKYHKNDTDIYIIANSIGAYHAMNTLQKCKIEKALFISPIVDMERLILDMLTWANVTEKDLCERSEIETAFGETLYWKYLKYVRDNLIQWNVPTEILYAGNDHLTSRQTIEKFAVLHNANLTVMENGEHWFHTDEQLAFLNHWMKNVI